jgi:arsenate reductase (thioredoxin)
VNTRETLPSIGTRRWHRHISSRDIAFRSQGTDTRVIPSLPPEEIMGRNIEEFELLNTRSQLRRAAMHAYDYYRGAIRVEECQAVVDESYDLLGRSAVIKHHLVALADRWSIERLRRLGIMDKRLGRTVPEVLFIDADDAGPAAAAAAMLAGYARGRVLTSSAGLKPTAGTDPAIARVATDLNVDLADAFPKAVTREALHVATAIVTLGEVSASDTQLAGATEEAAGQLPRTLHWDLPALDDETDDVIRAALEALDVKVLSLLADLLATPHGH